MKNQGLLGNPRFLLASSLVLAFSILISVSRVLLSEDPQAITIINNAAAVFCVLLAAILFIRVWPSAGRKDVPRLIWGQLIAGMILWAVAESIWAYYEVILGQEVPYPSLADAFWLIGYLVFSTALLTQYRIFQTSPSRQQKITLAIFVILFSLIVGLLVLWPIVQGFDPAKLLESLLNIAYPLFDLILLTLTLAIIFSLEQGRFALIWRVLGLGLVFMSIGDLIFSYASWNEIYYPDSQLNSLTLLIDTLYYLGYLTLGLGAYTYSLVSSSLQPVSINIAPRTMTKSNILVFIDRDGQIISLSDNFSNLVRSRTTKQFIKTSLGEALRIAPEVMAVLIQKTLQHGALSTQPLEVRDSGGSVKTVWLTSLPVHDDQKQLVCIALVLRTNLNPEEQQERPLTEEQEMLVHYYLTQAGTYRSEENQVIKKFFLERIRLLYSLIQQFSGLSMADRLLLHLDQIAERNNWQFTFTSHEIGIPDEYEGEVLAAQVSTLLRAAKNYAVNMVNLKVVEQELKVLDHSLSRDELRFIDKYSLRSAVLAEPVPSGAPSLSTT